MLRWLRRKNRKKGEMALSAVVIRKDGTKEDLGVISKSPVEFKAEGGTGGGRPNKQR